MWLTDWEWGSSSNTSLICSPAQGEQKWAGTGMEAECPWKKISRWSKFIRRNILGVQRTVRGEEKLPGAQQSCSLCSACSLLSSDQPSTIFFCLIFQLEMLCFLFFLLMLLFIRKTILNCSIWKLSAVLFSEEMLSILSALHSCQSLSWAWRGRKRGFFLFPGSPKKA